MFDLAKRSLSDRRELFELVAERRGLSEIIVEKDFWVSWMLGLLFLSEDLKDKILFKGGTSLSKVFGLISRFSEDIDLILDWTVVCNAGEPYADRSKTKQNAFNKEVVEASRVYIREQILPDVRRLIQDQAKAEIPDSSPDVIEVVYPGAFEDDYLRPTLRLEIGPLAAWIPNASYLIEPYAAQEFPTQFTCPQVEVRVVEAERTFWEKVTILHQEAHRPSEKACPARYSRHYYDLWCMGRSTVRPLAMKNLSLLADVVCFKSRFYPCAWARYDLAIPGSMKLVPPDHVVKALERDYREMEHMIYGERPSFSELMNAIGALEQEINALRRS